VIFSKASAMTSTSGMDLMMSTPVLMRRDVLRPLGWRLRAGLVTLGLVAVVLALAGASAEAAPKGVVATFGQEGSAAGDFSTVGGVAVNQDTGDVYVVDVNNERVQQFDADGVFIRMWGGGVVDGSDEHQVCTSGCQNGSSGSGGAGQFFFGGNMANIDVGADGSVYVADTIHNRIQQFTAEGEFVRMWGFGVQTGADVFEVCTAACLPGLAGSGDGQLSSPISVAVDPSDGDVVVADRDNGRIQRFDSAGGYLSQFPFSNPSDVAVDGAGRVYAFEFGGSVRQLDAAGDVQRSFPGIFPSQVDAVGDRVFISDYNENFDGFDVLEYDAGSGELVEHHHTANTSFDMTGLAVNAATGRIYVGDGPNSRVFILDDPVHTVTVEPTTDIATRSATLHGTVDPNSGFPVGYHFEVSIDGETWTRFPDTDIDVGNGPDPVPVTAEATGLEPGRAYRVRLVATDQFGARVISTGNAGDFITDPEPPAVQTGPATQITSTAAVLTGDINANNAPTTYYFEWGNTTDYGSSTPTANITGGSPTTVTQQLSGLLPNTTYHYRLVATNSEGTTTGMSRTFATRAVATPPPGRGYELVTPAYKVGGVGVGAWYGGPDAVGNVGFAAHDGERFAANGQNGSVLMDGAYGYRNDMALAERTSAGWVHQPGISRRAHGPQPTTDISMDAASPDISLSAWLSNASILKLFPEMESWDSTEFGVMMMRQWAAPEWELFGPTHPSQDVAPGSTASALGSGPKAIAADGSAAVVTAPLGIRGLAGSRDPTSYDSSGILPAARNVYLDEVTGAFSDTFPGDDSVRELVNVCTPGTIRPTASGSEPCPPPLSDRDHLISPGGASLSAGSLGLNPPASVISADGSRVFFMSPDPDLFGAAGPSQLFVRQRHSDGRVMTRWISQTEVVNQEPSLRAAVFFEGASRDGDKVFFQTTSPLTDDDPNGGCGAPCTAGGPSGASSDLYMYDLPDGPDGDPSTPDSDPAGGRLTRISAGPDDSDCNTGAGTLRFVSDDASRAYFTCSAPLTGIQAPSNGTITAPDGETTNTDRSNLYLYDAAHPAPARWKFIARLPRTGALGQCATSATGRGSTIQTLAGGSGNSFSISGSNNCVRGTPDGSLVTMFTDGRLTADDPDEGSGDVYGYEATNDELTRLSAPRGGSGGDYPCEPRKDASSARCHGDGGIGPGAMPLEMLGVAVRPNGDRLALFESRSRLVAEDADDSYDVYQWREGELSLVTTGVSDPDGAFYVGNDRSGLNIYFATRDQLTWQDRDRVLDIYTARVGGGITQPQSQPSCPALTDGCQGAGAAPVAPRVDSTRPGGRNATPGRRKALALRRLTASQLRRAARRGRIRVRVHASSPGRLSVSARAKVGGRSRIVARTSKRVAKPGLVTVSLRLNAGARAVLGRGRPLHVTLRVSQRGAKTRSMSVRLRRNNK
jgi:hypothetical protein